MKNFNTITLFILFCILNLAACTQVTTNKEAKPSSDTSVQSEELTIKDLRKNFPPPKGWVNDFAGILTINEIKSLDSILTDHEKKSNVEITVVTLDSSFVSADNFDNYTLLIAVKWGVGKKEKGNGILIAMASDLRRIRIRNGTGIEKRITNTETQQIIDEVAIPNFRYGQFFEGLRSTILELIKKLEDK